MDGSENQFQISKCIDALTCLCDNTDHPVQHDVTHRHHIANTHDVQSTHPTDNTAFSRLPFTIVDTRTCTVDLMTHQPVSTRSADSLPNYHDVTESHHVTYTLDVTNPLDVTDRYVNYSLDVTNPLDDTCTHGVTDLIGDIDIPDVSSSDHHTVIPDVMGLPEVTNTYVTDGYDVTYVDDVAFEHDAIDAHEVRHKHKPNFTSGQNATDTLGLANISEITNLSNVVSSYNVILHSDSCEYPDTHSTDYTCDVLPIEHCFVPYGKILYPPKGPRVPNTIHRRRNHPTKIDHLMKGPHDPCEYGNNPIIIANY